MTADHFSAVAREYARFRPDYPTPLFAHLAELAPHRERAWDCGTGTGQAAAGLASFFAQVVATDLSPALLRQAARRGGTWYAAARAEAAPLRRRSVALVTVAQALHWLDRPAFFAEVRRVLVSGGILAVWTYASLRVGDPGVDRVLRRFYTQRVGPHWPPQRALVEAGYRTVALPFDELSAPAFTMAARWTLPDIVGHLRTWSGVQQFRAQRGIDPVTLVEPELAAAWPAHGGPVAVTWPLALRIGRV